MKQLGYILALLFGAILLVCVFFGIKIYLNLQAGSPTNVTPVGYDGSQLPNVPVSNGTYHPPITTNSVTSRKGVPIPTKDFTGSDPGTKTDPYNAGSYFIGPQPNSSNPQYLIEYLSSTQYFNVSLLQKPLSTTRRNAELDLMDHLGITEVQMCQLKYSVSVPAWIDTDYSGTDLRFSFCAAAVPLP